MEPKTKMMNETELQNLVSCYINVEGYTDFRSIYSLLKQEYPGAFEPKMAMQVVRKVLMNERLTY